MKVLVVGIKATIGVSLAVSFGGVIGISALTIALVEVLMKNSFKKSLSVWCGAALMRVRSRPHDYDSAWNQSGDGVLLPATSLSL